MRPFKPFAPLAALLLGLSFGATFAVAAETRTFPYEAVVSAEQLYVRGGPGPKYYPTSKLRRGDRVLVHRHDPGGWFMIAPPPGSFSWIPSKYVQRIDNERGTVTANNVIVRVGSFESDNTRDLFQRKLSEGDEVRILGEKVLTGDGGRNEPWLRIEPPKSEWRWVMGKHVSAVVPGADPSARRNDSFDNRIGDQIPTTTPTARPRTALKPSRLIRTSATSESASDYDPATTSTTSMPEVRQPTPKQRKPAVAFEDEELEHLDARLQGILEQPPLEWDFESVTQDYRTLRERTTSAEYQLEVDRRLYLIEQKLRVKARHLEIQKLGEETMRRDLELAAEQREHESRLLGAPARVASQFDGAGIVQHAALNVPQAPRYVLLAPNGRILTYLQPGQGIDLEAWIGKAAGLYGARSFRNDLHADLLVVNKLTAVRLAQ